jgi:hypothetical protein
MSDWDRFANGITAPTPRFQKQHPNSEPPQPRYGDEWANETFNQKGPDLFEIQRRSHTDGASRRK